MAVRGQGVFSFVTYVVTLKPRLSPEGVPDDTPAFDSGRLIFPEANDGCLCRSLKAGSKGDGDGGGNVSDEDGVGLSDGDEGYVFVKRSFLWGDVADIFQANY